MPPPPTLPTPRSLDNNVASVCKLQIKILESDLKSTGVTVRDWNVFKIFVNLWSRSKIFRAFPKFSKHFQRLPKIFKIFKRCRKIILSWLVPSRLGEGAQGVMGRKKEGRRLADPVFKTADEAEISLPPSHHPSRPPPPRSRFSSQERRLYLGRVSVLRTFQHFPKI